MSTRVILVWMGLTLMATSAVAQSTVTTSGATSAGTIPVFGPSSNSTVTNSIISQSGGNVGIGTTNPLANLHSNVGSGSTPATAGFFYGSTAVGTFSDIDGRTVNSATLVVGSNWGSNCSGCGMINAYSAAGSTFWVGTNGYVGAGTINPLARLHSDVGPGTTPSMAGLFYGSTAAGTFADPNGRTANAATLVVGSNWAANCPDCAIFNAYSGVGSVLWVGTNGAVGIGTTNPQAKLEVNGNLRFTADGSVQSTAWTGVLCGGDYAESVDVTGDRKRYEPGDVLVIDPDTPGKFLKSAEPYSTAVTGIYSTKPGATGRRQTTPKSADEVPMAMIGIVPTKVSAENGGIRPGDLLVTSSQLGYAMKGTDKSRMLGAVIGKAIGSLGSGTGVVDVVVTLQ